MPVETKDLRLLKIDCGHKIKSVSDRVSRVLFADLMQRNCDWKLWHWVYLAMLTTQCFQPIKRRSKQQRNMTSFTSVGALLWWAIYYRHWVNPLNNN